MLQKMKHKITWHKTEQNGDFDRGTKITIVRWADKNFALFLDKTKEEVEASFAVRLGVMEAIEFDINKGVFDGHETYLSKEHNEVYNENCSAELKLLNERMMKGFNEL